MRKVEIAISPKSGHKKPSLSKVEFDIPEVEIAILVYVFEGFRKSKPQSWKSKLQFLYTFLKASEIDIFTLDVSCMVSLFVQVRKQTMQKWNKLSSRLRDIWHLESTY